MAGLDDQIAMGVQVPNTAAPINQYVDQQRAGQANDADNQDKIAQAHLAAAEAFKSHLDGLNTQDQMKLHAQIAGAAGLQPFLDKGDTQGAINYVKTMPFNVDDQTKQQALGMLQSGDPAQLQQLQHYTKSLTLAGQVYGILPDTTFAQYQSMDKTGQQDYGNYKMASFGGKNASVAELNMLNNDPTTANLPLPQKLQMVNRKLGTNLTVDSSGQVQDMGGAVNAEANLSYGHKAGENASAYETNINKDAANATGAKQMLGEVAQMAQNFTPNNLAPMKQKLGEWAITAGFDPKVVNDALGNVGDMQALQKLTAQMATQSMRSFTSRGTQMEFNTFMQNNPNAALTTEGFQKILGFMGQVNDAKIQKQQSFNQWKGTQQPSNYQNFDDQWNQQLNQGYDKNISAFVNKDTPPADGAKKAPDGNWYVPDPNRQGKYLRVDQ